MERGRLEEAWMRESALMSLLANCNRDPKKHGPYKPKDFNPFMQSAPVSAKEGLRMLRKAMDL